MNKFKYLLSFQVKKRFKSKAFLIANIVIFVLLLLVTNLNHIIAAFDKGEADVTMYVFNKTDDPDFITKLEFLDENFSQASMGKITFEEITSFDEAENNHNNVLVVSKADNILSAKIYQADLNLTIRTQIQTYLSQLKYNYLLEDKLTPEELEALATPIELDFEEVDDANLARQILSFISMVLSIPIFMLITFGVQFLGGSIIEEKSTKAIEYLLANVSPEQHFFSKILTSFIFLVAQMVLMIAYAVVGGLLSTFVFGSGMQGLDVSIANGFGIPLGDIQAIIKQLPLAILFIVLFAGFGGLLYMVIMAFLAAISSSSEDFQTFQSPLMFLMLGGFYGAIFGSMAGPNIVIKILGYIPFFSPFMTPGLFLAGTYNWIETLISLVLLMGTSFLAYKLIIPVYKTSILSYDTDKFFKRIKKAFKRSKV